MRTVFQKQLASLNDEMIEMGTMIERAIEKAVYALAHQDVDAAKEVIAADEEIDRQERTVENLCLKLLLQQQPVAQDLRTVSSALKMITDMERIGNYAADIAEITVSIIKQQGDMTFDLIQQMGKETTVMLIGSIDAFVNRDSEKARQIAAQDDVVDALLLKTKEKLVQKIRKDAKCGGWATDMLMIAKYFERIGDHAARISDWVVFSIQGEHVQNAQKNSKKFVNMCE